MVEIFLSGAFFNSNDEKNKQQKKHRFLHQNIDNSFNVIVFWRIYTIIFKTGVITPAIFFDLCSGFYCRFLYIFKTKTF